VPTVTATGLPGYEAASINAMFAPIKTAPAIIARLNQEIVWTVNTPEAKERLLNAGLESVGSTPEQLAAVVKSEMSRLGKIIKDSGVRAD